MASAYLISLLLLTLSFTLATQLELWRVQSDRHRTETGGVLQILIGDSKRLFANHFVTKADVYLHSGVYPSIFDQARQEKSHLASAADSKVHGDSCATHDEGETPHEDDDHGEPAHDDDHESGGHDEHAHEAGSRPARDWIETFGRNFYPTKHVHLGEKGDQREILPWLRLAADLNPNEDEIYALGAYWLRQRMGKVKEAEQFLREGWRANPTSFAILFELGRLFEENHKDDVRARNLYEAALRYWQQQEPGKEKPDDFALMQITGHLAKIAERQGDVPQAIGHLQMLQKVSPNPDSIGQRIAELEATRLVSP